MSISSWTKERLIQAAVYLILLACFFLYFQEFRGRPYRQDETVTLAWAEEGNFLTIFDSITSTLIQPGFFVILDAWVTVFGSQETAGRALAHLVTLLTLAVVYRLGKKIGGDEIGFYSVLLLGTWPIFKFYSNELHYYSTFWLGCSLLVFGVISWLRSLSTGYVCIAILGGSLAILSHLYAYYLILALGITALFLGSTRSRHFWFGFFTIGIGLGLVSCIWLIPNAYILLFSISKFELFPDNVLSFTSWQHVSDYLALNPPFATVILLVVGVTAVVNLSTRQRGWQRSKLLYPVVAASLFLLLIIFVNLTIARQFHYRYLALVLILLAPITAVALSRLEISARVTLIGIILLGMFSDERIFNGTGPYLEMVDYINQHNRENSLYIIDALDSRDSAPYNYYVSYRLDHPTDRHNIYFLTHEYIIPYLYPIHLGHVPTNTPTVLGEQILQFVGQADQVWRIIGTYGPASEEALIPFQQRYALHRRREWPIYDGMYGGVIEEYRRIPEDLQPMARANELTLMHWRLKLQDSARPCQTVALDSWWQASEVPTSNYSLALVLVGQDGQGISQDGGGISPTLSGLWSTEQPYLDERHLFIPCDLPPGTYPIVFALYDSTTLANATFTTPSGDPIGRNLFLTQINVSAP